MLAPVLVMVAVTLLVYFRLYFARLPHIVRKRINPQTLATRADMEKTEISKYEQQVSDNIKNLFEAPVLFYVLALVIEIASVTDAFFLGLAWFFVASRAVHSLIHCTYNKVTQRFTVFIIGVLTLTIMMLRLLWVLL
jgi:hypothetical protein